MGLFSQRPEHEQNEWAGLPSEPRDTASVAERLDEAPALDLLDVGLGAAYTTTVFPVAPPAPEAVDATEGDAGGDPGPDSDDR